MIRSSLMLCVLCLLCACSSMANKADPVIKLPACYSAFYELDQLALQASGTLIANRIAGMPWLRSNRLMSHKIAGLDTVNQQQLSTLLKSMSQLAKRGLQLELKNVPAQRLHAWRQAHTIEQSNADFLESCQAALIHAQQIAPKITRQHLKKLPRDNDYSLTARILGAYPFASVPFRLGVVKEQKQLAEEWGKINSKPWYAYQPSKLTKKGTKAWQRLNQHAPTWYIDSQTPVNQPGQPVWSGGQLIVNTNVPVTYAFESEGVWQGRPGRQLNYVLWFSERPQLSRLDWVAGQHDALVFRVHLDPLGKVIAYDSIHLCGCWYRLFVPDTWAYKESQHYWEEPISMHRIQLPTTTAPSMSIYVQADTHQIQYTEPSRPTAPNAPQNKRASSAMPYQLRPFDELYTLPTSNGSRAVFNKQGYVEGSERLERWLFWPMGVKNPGALRRFGDHAISFIGRRYFDDPNLLSHFSLAPGNN